MRNRLFHGTDPRTVVRSVSVAVLVISMDAFSCLTATQCA